MKPSNALSGLFDYMVNHRTAANLLLCIMLFGGIAAGLDIRTQYFPDIVREDVDIDVTWSGAGPDDMDRAVVEVLAPQLLSVEGVEEATSVAREGRASIELEFEADWDMGRATDEVKAIVDMAKSNLPEGVDEPEVSRSSFRDRVTNVVIYGPIGMDQLSQFAENLQTRLFQSGVTRVSIYGTADPIIRVMTSERKLIRHDLQLRDIADVLAAEMETTPAGELGNGAARLRTGQERRTEKDFGDIVVKAPVQGEKLLLRDVATLNTEGVESGRAYFHKGLPAVTLRVDRNATGDTISIQRAVEDVVADFQTTLPKGTVVQLTQTRSQGIIDRLNILVENGAFGLLLVLCFLFLFLSARTAFWVAMGIPVAMAATVGMMFAFGMTLNMISVFALIICLGIVVDDAIVVGEHADFLARKGYKPAEAAALSAKRMAAPVFCASITTVIAFSGLTTVGGFFGKMIESIPWVVSVVMIASLIESFLILPAHMRHALSSSKTHHWYDWPNRLFNKGFSWFLRRAFRPFMGVLIRLRYPVIGLSVMGLLLTSLLFLNGTVQWRFFNAPERGVISANIAMLPGATRDDTRAMVAEMQRALDVVDAKYAAEYGQAPVIFSLSTIGGNEGRGLSGADAKDIDQLGGFSIELIDPDLRPYSAFKFIGDWQKEIRRSPLLETLALRGERSGPGGDGIDVELYGPSTETLKEAAEYLKQVLSTYAGVSGLEDTLSYDKTELNLTLTPRGEALGFTTDGIARVLRDRLSGIEVAEFPVGRRTATVKVSLPDEEMNSAFLYETRVRAPSGSYVALSEIVNIDGSFGFASVRRQNGLRTLKVTGSVSEDDPEMANTITARLQDTILPEVKARFDVDSAVRGLAEQERDFLSDIALGFALCLGGIYLTLCWIFASWTRPFVIVLIIPFGVIGMLWGHYWHGLPLSMFSIVGFIGMAGIIINDSIVLVTTIDEYAKTKAFKQAVVDGVCDRLRAVTLTSATTVFGLAPLLFETSRQAQFLLPTVITLAYGLGFGLFLVVLVTPAILMIQNDFGQMLKSGRRLAGVPLGKRKGLGTGQSRGQAPAE